ncbi:MAG TPA: sulfite exporter TauE/SafE family protein [Prosthecobacter sp.]
MTDLTQLIQQGGHHAWLYIPVAVLLGALHGLEPGHSKTMMAAFIIAIRGTVWQAVLLGLSAAISHSLLIWLLAGLALYYGGQWNAEHTEPYFHLASAAMIFGLALWMYARTRRELRESDEHGKRYHHEPAAPSPPPALHDIAVPEGLIDPKRIARLLGSAKPSVMLDTGHGWLKIEIADDNGASRFRIHPCRASGEILPMPKHTRMTLETARLDGSSQLFQFEAKATFWESTAVVPEPHEFVATLSMGHDDHAHTYRLRFSKPQSISGPTQQQAAAAEVIKDEDNVYQDAHERAHAQDIERRFEGRSVTTPQIILFGITGGLMPCPAAFTVLLVCLQIKRVALGFGLVAAFSFGLALTMVVVGVIAAWSIQKARTRFTGFGEWMRRAPYISCLLLVLLAGFMAWQGWQGLSHPHHHP